MPHCIAEHSSDIDVNTLLPAIYHGALESGLFASDGSDIKVRSLAYDSYTTGGVRASFIHVAIKVLSGRTQEQKSSLSNRVLQKIEALELKNLSVTVEVIDMDRLCYAKKIL
ncbi:5-carboxymethyl-2-hydroxymuconate Delta-isomerase [Pectobacterium brasiliense]|uniref:5-carboxymethyl-2-hydroxymuconate Delta-isomerase n=1 Tax=Pectobacterium brasiliense TaxID=180957 RepID=UPI0001A438B2|nr:5-carboxymethyl-2-hydroxymuconate isomerase [Pectobacterium brasiliense]KGA22394.1 5-carboxymethyl-2-hydroxymuconate isomerase [Pectobacterium brasiliense]KHS77204.1 5-carboxymethyl-2-hydroxymuconate isomerase [Pectobacterium brasiliense]KRF65408.1 5-carboxymethyl-2-hydroxymuconate isomerase [Pectobacterium brasiliense]MBN3187810.1 5-carboxymethyl-2-hydroxymuconate isomerase [Pectobacterium brasiliense]QHG28761.1 5-carboxymethyl-2-hydroxymuconate isomerase [Pectobacterium brasiliense]